MEKRKTIIKTKAYKWNGTITKGDDGAIATAISDNSNVYLGAYMTGYEPDGDIHFTSNQDLSDFAAAWWTAIGNWGGL